MKVAMGTVTLVMERGKLTLVTHELQFDYDGTLVELEHALVRMKRVRNIVRVPDRKETRDGRNKRPR